MTSEDPRSLTPTPETDPRASEAPEPTAPAAPPPAEPFLRVEGVGPQAPAPEVLSFAVPDLSALAEPPADETRRRKLLAVLAVLLVALCGVVYLFVRYLNRPEPLPELLPVPVEVNYPPHFVFAFYDVNAPLGVALSPDGKRVYVTESEGDRLIKMFDTQGNLIRAFAPPRTTAAERAPVYIAVDARGRVFVSDRLQHAIFVFDAEGNYLDAILGPDLTLSEYIAKHTGQTPDPGAFAYDIFEPEVHYRTPDGDERTLPRPDAPTWAPLGVSFDPSGRLIVTDVAREQHRVLVFPAEVIAADDWTDFEPEVFAFGAFGEGEGQFQFPNKAVVDALGRFIVSDGNNGRLSVWSPEGEWLFVTGTGGGGAGLNLPRGLALDERQRLHVVDAVGQVVRVYDFASEEPAFLFTFGTMGSLKGQFNYPNDIAIDATGRLYITDRANDRVQVWSY